ncbi:Glycine cleavage system H protein [Methyloversatilis universalis FAM5]|jgi:glycine cleavage system H protein|uniref:Glycine cleavage system H protein n=1 Tax=Methyloversatilis universalis (strain ATCC BAA-1314 / DSM 25237 / JCM 13912 / CCUG 52030 / FAM5) TaxID=1000565 RepID=F5R926_METUF|nr:glycine cleavage system protein GcvH [Methyloversatilis universalis]EGK72993.1 Glycine cleavage system H protein [Methyloversatilis universalis FAM5]
MNHPDNLRYTDTHEWVRVEQDGTVTVGITDHAQDALGDVVFLQLPDVGRTVARTEAMAVIESVKSASDIHAPVAGTVTAVNQAVADAPEQVNQDPYAAWMFVIKPDSASELDALLSADAYSATLG